MTARPPNSQPVQETVPPVLNTVLTAHEEGQPALLVTGRSLYDLVVHEGKLRPLVESLRLICRQRYGLTLVRYSLAGGLDWDRERLTDNRDRQTIETALRAHGLLDLPQDQDEPVRAIRGISQLSRSATDGLRWADGRPLRFAFLLEFSEHLTPALANGTQTNEQLIAIELAHMNAQSLALRQSGNLVLFHSRGDGLVDELVSGALRTIRLPQPDAPEKKVFVEAARHVYPKASFQPSLSEEEVVRLTARTPNRGLETLLRSSHRTGRKISVSELVEQKSHDVEQISEQTLTVLDTSRVDGLDLRGANMEVPRRVLHSFAEKLRQGNPNVPAQLLLVGSPGAGKTDLAILTASQAQVAAYQMNSPKGGIVGETERKCRLQYMALKEWTPNVAFVDEITEAMPLERSDFDGDSGASRAVTAAMLSALSDETRRGSSLLLATTNCPWRMGAAMRSRFVILPVLQPLEGDLPGIIEATARRIDPECEVEATGRKVCQAAETFFLKGATPRHIRTALGNALLLRGNLDADAVLFAAHDLVESIDSRSAVYSDLWAVKACSSRSFLPWSLNPTEYPYPPHLKGIVDATTGEVDARELDKRLEALKPHANL